MNRHILAVPAVVAVALLTAGCAGGPSRTDVSNAFDAQIEQSLGVSDTDPVIADLIDKLTDRAMAGRCGDEAFRADLNNPDAIVDWDIVCSVYFPDDMSDAQRDRARRETLSAVAEDVTGE